MKKNFIALIAVLLIFTGCGNKNIPKIDDCSWKINSVQSSKSGEMIYNNEDSTFKNIEIKCVINQGKIEIKDNTHKKTYKGKYELSKSQSDSNIYKIMSDNKVDIAVVSFTKYMNKTKVPTLIIRTEDYTLNFIAE